MSLNLISNQLLEYFICTLTTMVHIIFSASLILVISITIVDSAEIELRKYYEIENAADGGVLTVGGDPIENTKIITSERRSVDFHVAKQRFWIGSRIIVDRTTYEISPEPQNAFSSLVLEQHQDSGLLYQNIRLLNRSQWWKITDVGDGNWHIQNDQSGTCLSSSGLDNQVVSEICSASSRNQTWFFNILKTGGTIL